MLEYIYNRFFSQNGRTQQIKKFLAYVGYDYRHWTRPVMHEACTRLLTERGMENLDVLEIFSGEWRTFPFRSYREMNFPEYDICEDILDNQFNLIIADQVFEHLLRLPYDCTRWTETGIKYFLAESGFPLDKIIAGSWGNRACVKANFNRWARRGWFGSLKNEPDFPVTVWALAQKE